MYYSAIGLLAALVLLIENQDILIRRSDAFAQPAWRVYRRFLFTVLIYYVTDVLWGVLESQKLALLLFVDTSLYFVAMAVGVLFWTQYTVTYLEEENAFGRFLVWAGRVFAAMVTLVVVVNHFLPVLFTVSAQCEYQALWVRYVGLFTQILLLLLISVYALTAIVRGHGAAEKRKKYRTLALFGMIMAALLFAQVWFPLFPLYAVAYLLGTCLLRAFVIGDEKEAYRHDLEEAEKIKALKQSIDSLMDNMPALAFSKDAETGVYLACNQAFAEYANKQSPAGVIGLTDAEIFDAETAKHFTEDDSMALSMDEPYVFYEDVPDAAGNRRQFQTTKLKYIDTAGRLCTLGMCQDVTDLVRVQRENATTKEAYEKARSAGIVYTHIAQTLARGYANLFYVDLDTEEFIEYRTEAECSSLTEARRGGNFFEQCRADIERNVYPDDREACLKAMEREVLLAALDRSPTIISTYRLLTEQGPTYVSMKVSRMEDNEHALVIGVTDVNEQMQARHLAERMKEESIAYARINALTGDFLCVYVVVPETGRYRQFSATAGFETFSLPKAGEDFFAATRENAAAVICPDDLDRFLAAFTREGVLTQIERNGIFAMTYRLMLGGKPAYVKLKAAMVEEKDGRRLVVGINDIDTQVRQEEDYARRLAQAQSKASVDALTGVKNKFAYLDAEKQLDRQIGAREAPEFAIVILDVNDLKKINDTEGHQAGDQYLRDAARIVCDIFKRSPVFRIGGDEFAVIAQGADFARLEELLSAVHAHNAQAARTGGIVIACGMSKFEGDPSVAAVFERADLRMYENKSELKGEDRP